MKCFEFFGREITVASSGDPCYAVELEPIVAGRTDRDVDAESGSVADIWNSSERYPPQTKYDHISRRRLRSRSSPVRAIADKNGWKVRARSPSACSPRRRAQDRSRDRFTQHPRTRAAPTYTLDSVTPSEDYMQASNIYWCEPETSCGSAYFSPRPPAAPLRLVPIVTPAQPPKAPSMYSGVTRIARVSFAKNGPEDCYDTVSSLLWELVASLPLQTSNRKPVACASSIEHTLHSDTNEPITSRSCVKIRHSSKSTYGDRIRRSIATQAKGTQDDDASDGQKSDVAPAEEWLGGVRALRDSHVRLVLRQLRHINRLNRALDRAARPPPPPPPSSPRAPPAFAPPAVVTAHAQA